MNNPLSSSLPPSTPPSSPSGTELVPRPLRFVHQGQVKEVSGLPPTTTVLQWLREHAHCTGTKEGCAEGDCGACTVVLASEDDTAPDGLALRTVNACIQFLPTLDGQALLTVEDLSTLNGGSLHPCQQAMVDCHGSQCGFCTPGFVMSLWNLYQQHPPQAQTAPTRAAIADALSGNLCRCTGYRPILDAGQQMFTMPQAQVDWAPMLAALKTLAPANTTSNGTSSTAPPTMVYEGPDAAAPTQTTRFIAPQTLDELAHWRANLPQARLLAGSTDIGLWVTKQFRALGDIIYLGRVRELQVITADASGVRIGAGASLEAAWGTLAQHIPALREIWLRFASPPVRHAGTMGGNIANGSPIGDSAPVLLALGATLQLRCGTQTRTVPLHGFYLDYMRNQLAPGEFIESMYVPLPQAGQSMRAYKISKRRDSDISALCAGLWLHLSSDTIVDARVAMGGMAATARRAPLTEAALVGQPWTQATLLRAQAALAQDFSPLSDMRASDAYRSQVAQNLLERWWLETRTSQPLPASAVQVWPATL